MSAVQIVLAASVSVLGAGFVVAVCRQARVSAESAFAVALFALSQVAIVGFLAITMGSDESTPLWAAVVVLAASALCVVADLCLGRAAEDANARERGRARVRLLEEQVEALKEHDALLARENEKARAVRERIAAELVDARDALDRQEGADAAERAGRAAGLLAAAPVRLCDHRVIDALLAGKREACSERCIRFDAQIELSDDSPFPASVLVALFANALDNAIASCERVQRVERFIDVRARTEAGFFVIVVRNACEPGVVPDGGSRHRSRSRIMEAAASGEPLPEHGWGLGIMRDIAARYDGTLETLRRDGSFEIRIAIEAPSDRTGGGSFVAKKESFMTGSPSAEGERSVAFGERHFCRRVFL